MWKKFNNCVKKNISILNNKEIVYVLPSPFVKQKKLKPSPPNKAGHGFCISLLYFFFFFFIFAPKISLEACTQKSTGPKAFEFHNKSMSISISIPLCRKSLISPHTHIFSMPTPADLQASVKIPANRGNAVAQISEIH